MGELVGIEKDFKSLLFCKAMLCLLGADVNLKEDVRDVVIGLAPFLNLVQEVAGVNALHKRRKREDQFKLIGLKMAYEVPFYVFGEDLHLCGEVLRTALRKDSLAGLVSPLDGFGRVIFGNCHQFYIRRQFLP